MDWKTQRAIHFQAKLASSTFLAFALYAIPLAAQDAPALRSTLSTQQCADQWLDANQLELGANLQLDGSFTFVSSAEEQLQVPMNSDNWVAARQDSFEKARLNAMREMVAYFKEGVRSDNTMTTLIEGDAEMQISPKQGSADFPQMTSPSASAGQNDSKDTTAEPATEDLAQKAERPSGGPTLSSALRQQINAASEDVLVGVAVARQCEGLSDADGTVTGGKYSVSVTLLWSTKLQQLAQSMFTSPELPVVDLPKDTPSESRQTLKERFAVVAKAKPGWMAYELGVRVYADNDGENVVIGFGAVPATSLKSADVSRADLMARNYIAEFQRTQVSGVRDADSRTSYSEGGPAGSGSFSDGSRFNDKIEVKTQKKQLTGIYPLATWRGRHPESDKEMVVVARAWKRSAQAQAQKMLPTRGLDINGVSGSAPTGNIAPQPDSGLSMKKGDF